MFQESTSGLFATNQAAYSGLSPTGGSPTFATYGYEYQPGLDGYVTWVNNGAPSWSVGGVQRQLLLSYPSNQLYPSYQLLQWVPMLSPTSALAPFRKSQWCAISSYCIASVNSPFLFFRSIFLPTLLFPRPLEARFQFLRVYPHF